MSRRDPAEGTSPPRDPSPLRATRSLLAGSAISATLIATTAVTVLFIVTYSVMSSALTQSLAATVDADLAGLADIYATSGRRELIARIGDRQTMTSLDDHSAHYQLAQRGRILAGDIGQWPALSAARSEQGHVMIDGARRYARATRLAPDLDLLVARDTSRESAILLRLIVSFLVSGITIIAAVTLVAWWRFRHVSQRLARINEAFTQGDSDAIGALRNEPRDDEIGALARHSGGALARQASLLDAQRLVADNVAHELRTPLLHLDGRLRGLLTDNPSSGTAEVLARARGDIRRITTMLDSLLDIASSEANRGSVAGLTAFDLAATVTDIAELYRNSMDEAGLRFETSVTPGVTMIGEPMQISRLLANLLDNAIKYVPSGGVVSLTVDEGPILVISDDGPGISQELQPTIFERFRRGRDGGHRPGHGLGLALARAIAARHDLSLTFSSTRRKSCTFLLHSPRGLRRKLCFGHGSK